MVTLKTLESVHNVVNLNNIRTSIVNNKCYYKKIYEIRLCTLLSRVNKLLRS